MKKQNKAIMKNRTDSNLTIDYYNDYTITWTGNERKARACRISGGYSRNWNIWEKIKPTKLCLFIEVEVEL